MITIEQIRAVGGIVHSDGNIFFKDISMLHALEAPAAPAGLLTAARDFYNATVADPKVKISATCPDARDHVRHLGERLRAEIQAALAAAPQAPER